MLWTQITESSNLQKVTYFQSTEIERNDKYIKLSIYDNNV